jgi:hypothetical protein
MRRLVLAAFVFTAGCGGAGSPGGSGADSGIEGRVVAAPTCPVETGDPACEPRPVAATVIVTSLDRSTEERVDSDADGRFTIGLPPGEYEIYAKATDGEGRLTPRPMRVTVKHGATTRVQVVLDTGIRTPG